MGERVQNWKLKNWRRIRIRKWRKGFEIENWKIRDELGLEIENELGNELRLEIGGKDSKLKIEKIGTN